MVEEHILSVEDWENNLRDDFARVLELRSKVQEEMEACGHIIAKRIQPVVPDATDEWVLQNMPIPPEEVVKAVAAHIRQQGNEEEAVAYEKKMHKCLEDVRQAERDKKLSLARQMLMDGASIDDVIEETKVGQSTIAKIRREEVVPAWLTMDWVKEVKESRDKCREITAARLAHVIQTHHNALPKEKQHQSWHRYAAAEAGLRSGIMQAAVYVLRNGCPQLIRKMADGEIVPNAAVNIARRGDYETQRRALLEGRTKQVVPLEQDIQQTLMRINDERLGLIQRFPEHLDQMVHQGGFDGETCRELISISKTMLAYHAALKEKLEEMQCGLSTIELSGSSNGSESNTITSTQSTSLSSTLTGE